MACSEPLSHRQGGGPRHGSSPFVTFAAKTPFPGPQPHHRRTGRGTVVVEAAERSGTLATARHASNLARPLMAVPGPLICAILAGCNALIRGRRAACVTSAADIIAHMPS